MEYFNKAKAVKLRSHLGKYLVAYNGREKLHQSRKGSTRNATWEVELVEGKSHRVWLKSCHGMYLTATDTPFLLGMTGNRVVQSDMDAGLGWKYEWEPITEGFHVKLRSWCGTYLRGNGGTPPWRNSITHDDPYSTTTHGWILWGVEKITVGSFFRESSVVSSIDSDDDEVVAPVAVSNSYLRSSSLMLTQDSQLQLKRGKKVGKDRKKVVAVLLTYKTPKSKSLHRHPKIPHFPLISDPNTLQSPPSLPNSKTKPVFSERLHFTTTTTSTSGFQAYMDFFHRAKVVRLRSHHDKYLTGEDDEESVTQDRNGSSKNAKWVVEVVPEYDNIVRLKSCHGKYLTASNQPFLLGVTGRKVLQTLPSRLDSSVEWEPVRDGSQVKLKTRYGNFLRANGGLPPWRNSVTHDIPHRTSTQDWILWDVDVLEIHVDYMPPPPPPVPHSDSLNFESSTPSAVDIKSGHFSRQESSDSYVGSPPKMEGRTIYYHVAEDDGEVDDENVQGYSLIFKGNGVDELTRKFEEETGLEGVIVCTRSPLNGKLYPLRLQLPPNNVTMQVVLVLPSSKVAKDFEEQGLL